MIFFNCKDLIEPSTLPNILWLVAEDQSPEFFSMYGNDMISLPNLEKLTRDGTIYTNAYAPVPVCAPSRSALITGMYPSSIGTHNMRTYNAFKDVNEPSINIPSYSPILPEGVKMFTEYLRKAGYYCTNNSKEDYNFKTLPNAWDESGKKAHWKNRPKGIPFFSIFNFGITHESQIWKQSKKPLLVDPSKLIVPPIFPDNHIIRRDLAINFSRITAPYILLISLSSIGIAILNSLGRYFASSLGPVIFNAVLVFILILPINNIYSMGYLLSFGVTFSGVIQFLLVFYFLSKSGYKLNLRKPDNLNLINKFSTIARPQIITGLAVQANIVLSGIIASFVEGGISILYYAERLYQLPLALFGISIGTVLLPTLSGLDIKKDLNKYNLVIRNIIKR